MAKPTIKFTTVGYEINGNKGYRPLLESQTAVTDLDFCKEVVEAKRLAMSADELLHAIEMLGEVAALKVAEDGRPRAITKLIKWNRFAKGSLDSPSSTWDDTTCKAYIKPQLLADIEKNIDGTFVNENQGIKVKLNYVTYLGAQGVQNVIKSLTAFAGYGNHMEFDASAGDTAWLEDPDTGAKLADLTCTSSDVAQATFDFPPAIIALEAGKTLTFMMKSRGGVTDGATFTNKKTVTYLGYTGDAYVWNISTEGLAANTIKVDADKLVTINGAKLNGCEQVVLTLTTKEGTSDAISIAASDLVSNTADKVTLHFTQAMVDATSLKSHDLAGATGKLMFAGEEGMVSEFAFSYAE